MNTNVIESATAIGAETVKQEGDITVGKVYTFRKLNSTDTFLMFKILGKIGINEFSNALGKDTVKQLISGAKGGDTTAVGLAVVLEVANILLGNLPRCEQEIYEMLSNTSNLTVDQVKHLDFGTFAEMIIAFIKKDEFKDFVRVASTLFKSVN